MSNFLKNIFLYNISIFKFNLIDTSVKFLKTCSNLFCCNISLLYENTINTNSLLKWWMNHGKLIIDLKHSPEYSTLQLFRTIATTTLSNGYYYIWYRTILQPITTAVVNKRLDGESPKRRVVSKRYMLLCFI